MLEARNKLCDRRNIGSFPLKQNARDLPRFFQTALFFVKKICKES
jgi:hypothetical protein